METNNELSADLPEEPDGEAPVADEQPSSESYQLRHQRVLDYQIAAMAITNVLVSNLASINSGLFQIALRLEESIEEAMARTPIPVERLQRVYQAIDAHLRVSRQIDRFAQVELRAADARRVSRHKQVDVDNLGDKSSEPAAG